MAIQAEFPKKPPVSKASQVIIRLQVREAKKTETFHPNPKTVPIHQNPSSITTTNRRHINLAPYPQLLDWLLRMRRIAKNRLMISRYKLIAAAISSSTWCLRNTSCVSTKMYPLKMSAVNRP